MAKKKNIKQPLTDEQETILDAFTKLGKVYNVGRQGIITSFNGARVGSWRWDTNRMLLSAVAGETGAKFRKVVRKLTKDKVMKTEIRIQEEPDTQIKQKNPFDNHFMTQIFYVLTDLSKLSPGELDPIMKENGYFIIDSNLPILSEGDDEVENTNP